jgi:hypothetical protein
MNRSHHGTMVKIPGPGIYEFHMPLLVGWFFTLHFRRLGAKRAFVTGHGSAAGLKTGSWWTMKWFAQSETDAMDHKRSFVCWTKQISKAFMVRSFLFGIRKPDYGGPWTVRWTQMRRPESYFVVLCTGKLLLRHSGDDLSAGAKHETEQTQDVLSSLGTKFRNNTGNGLSGPRTASPCFYGVLHSASGLKRCLEKRHVCLLDSNR